MIRSTLGSKILIYLSTAIGLTPGGSTHLHINNTQNNTKQTKQHKTNKTTQDQYTDVRMREQHTRDLRSSGMLRSV
jgi:hypothetical protein